MARYGFVFTLNNYTPEQELVLQGAIGQVGVFYISYGREIAPTTNTPHLQGYLQSTQKLKDRMHKKLGIFVVPQERNATQARDYTQKDKNFFEAGTFDETIKGTFEKKQGERSDVIAVKDDIDNGKTYDEICETHFQTASRISKFIKERVQARDSGKQLDTLKQRFESSVLRPWQSALMDIVKEEACPRKIHWMWEPTGKVGKSWMATYLGAVHGATILTSGKKVDLAFIYAQKPTKIVLFDLSRTTEAGEDSRKHYLDGIYSLAEDLKNGRIVSTKYESKTVFFQPPHVIFFANYEPDYTKWSQDRYFVTRLD